MSLLTSEKYEMFEEIVDELRVLLGEKGVTGVLIEVHRGPLSKSIREFGDCLCPTHQESDIVIKVGNEYPEALRLANSMINYMEGPSFHVPHYEVREAAEELRRLYEVNQMLVESAEKALETAEKTINDNWEAYKKYGSVDEIEGYVKKRMRFISETLRQALTKAKEQA